MDNPLLNNVSMETTERSPIVEGNPTPSITDIAIIDENTALNVMVSYLHLAQKRGAYNIQESAKIWDCIKLFTRSH